ncbi:hypothetical protein GCM10009860_12920 [Microbacterium mitrae]
MPSVSAVIPVLSETKYTDRVAASPLASVAVGGVFGSSAVMRNIPRAWSFSSTVRKDQTFI